MPDVQIRIQAGLFTYQNSLNDFKQSVRQLVAKELDCLEDDGTPQNLTEHPGQIDVHVIEYRRQYVAFGGAQVLVQIQGYGQKDRMANITERLTNIKRGIYNTTPREISDIDQVSVTFIEIKEGCWV